MGGRQLDLEFNEAAFLQGVIGRGQSGHFLFVQRDRRYRSALQRVHIPEACMGPDDPQPLLAGDEPFLEIHGDVAGPLGLDVPALQRVQQPEL
jgi:hypothetical protein